MRRLFLLLTALLIACAGVAQPANAQDQLEYEATRQRALRTGQQGIPPERVAEVVEKALSVSNPRARYLVGRDAQIAARIAMLPARVKDRLLRPAPKVRPPKNVSARRPRPTGG